MERREPTYGAAVRIAELILMLLKSWRPLPVTQICEYFQISYRTVQRYKKALNENLTSSDGGKFLRTKKENGIETWCIADQEEITTTTFFRISSIYMSMIFLKSMKGTIFEDGLKNVWDIVTSELKPSSKISLELFEKKFRHTEFGRKFYSKMNSIITDILKGIIYNNKLQILYYSSNSLKNKYYIIHPYTLLLHRDSLYLHSYVEGYSDIRTFMIDRIKEVTVKKEIFKYPTNYNPDKMIDGSFGIFKLKDNKTYKISLYFKDTLYEYISSRLWHPTQKFIHKEHGDFIMEFELSNTKELIPWVLQFGNDVKILEPESLQNEIKEILIKTYNSYSS